MATKPMAMLRTCGKAVSLPNLHLIPYNAIALGMIKAIQPAMWERVEPGQYRTDTLGHLCADLVPRWDARWMFLHVDGVKPTNTAAERALRPAVLWRKGWYGTQSATGSRFVERNGQRHVPAVAPACPTSWTPSPHTGAGHPAPRSCR